MRYLILWDSFDEGIFTAVWIKPNDLNLPNNTQLNDLSIIYFIIPLLIKCLIGSIRKINNDNAIYMIYI